MNIPLLFALVDKVPTNTFHTQLEEWKMEGTDLGWDAIKGPDDVICKYPKVSVLMLFSLSV